MNNDAIPRGLFFLAGAASGLALGYYLHSEKGSALRKQLAEHWGGTWEDLGERAQEQLAELLQHLNTALDQGLNYAEILEQLLRQNLTEVSEETNEALEDAGTSFENGMERARARLQQKFDAAGLPPEAK